MEIILAVAAVLAVTWLPLWLIGTLLNAQDNDGWRPNHLSDTHIETDTERRARLEEYDP